MCTFVSGPTSRCRGSKRMFREHDEKAHAKSGRGGTLTINTGGIMKLTRRPLRKPE